MNALQLIKNDLEKRLALLKGVSNKPTEYGRGSIEATQGILDYVKSVEQNLPKWNEKDNRLMGNIVDVLEDYQVNDSYKEEIDWLYDLRQKLDTKTV